MTPREGLLSAVAAVLVAVPLGAGAAPIDGHLYVVSSPQQNSYVVQRYALHSGLPGERADLTIAGVGPGIAVASNGTLAAVAGFSVQFYRFDQTHPDRTLNMPNPPSGCSAVSIGPLTFDANGYLYVGFDYTGETCQQAGSLVYGPKQSGNDKPLHVIGTSYPNGLTCDAAGDLFVAAYHSVTVYADPEHKPQHVRTILGSSFSFGNGIPGAVADDQAGLLWVYNNTAWGPNALVAYADTLNGYQYPAWGVYTTQADTAPGGVAVRNGMIYAMFRNATSAGVNVFPSSARNLTQPLGTLPGPLPYGFLDMAVGR
jgi:hypothetical protein